MSYSSEDMSDMVSEFVKKRKEAIVVRDDKMSKYRLINFLISAKSSKYDERRKTKAPKMAQQIF